MCAYDSESTPNQIDARFKNWIEKGLHMWRCEGRRSLQTLKQTFRKSRPLQTSPAKKLYTPNIKGQKPARPFIQLFLNAERSETKKAVLSQIYKSLHDFNNHSTTTVAEAAHHYHVCWDCKHINNYCRDVQEVIQNICSTYLLFDFKSMFVGH